MQSQFLRILVHYCIVLLHFELHNNRKFSGALAIDIMKYDFNNIMLYVIAVETTSMNIQ